MPNQTIDVTGLLPHQVLRALYEHRTNRLQGCTPAALIEIMNSGKPLCDHELHAEITYKDENFKPVDHPPSDARGQMYLWSLSSVRLPDYFRGVPIKLSWREIEGKQCLEGTEFYDRDHGEGRCQLIIDALLSKFSLHRETLERDWYMTYGGTPQKHHIHAGILVCGECEPEWERGSGPSCVYLDQLSPAQVRVQLAMLRDPEHGLYCSVCDRGTDENPLPRHWERISWCFSTPLEVLANPESAIPLPAQIEFDDEESSEEEESFEEDALRTLFGEMVEPGDDLKRRHFQMGQIPELHCSNMIAKGQDLAKPILPSIALAAKITPPPPQYNCGTCGGTQIQVRAWVDAQTNLYIDDVPDDGHGFCVDCDENIKINYIGGANA